MRISLKARFASFLIRFFHLSTLIRRLYPIATDVVFEEVEVRSLIDLGQFFRVRVNIDSCLIRVGSANDGGYLLLDDFRESDVLLSMGIGDNNSFDVEMAKKISQVHMFDHTIDQLPEVIHNGYFHKVGISDSDSQNFKTVPQLLLDFPTDQEFILKIDIEGDEWKIFDNLEEALFSRFRQITGEFHGFHSLINQPDQLERANRVLSKLVSNHRFVNLHPNNWARVDLIKGMLVPDVIEFTLVREDLVSEIKVSEKIEFRGNQPNNPDASEIYLGLFSYL